MRIIPIEIDGSFDAPVRVVDEVVTQVIEATVSLYQRRGFVPPWTGYLAIINDEVVGTCGFAGPPIADEAEIAYFTLPGNEGKGIAKAMAKLLLGLTEPTAAHQGIQFIAHTMPEHGPSTSILQRMQFVFSGAIEHPEDGRVWKWRRNRIGG